MDRHWLGLFTYENRRIHIHDRCGHGRDCDGTPLYELCADPEDNMQENPRFRNAKWHGGYSEESLTVIRLPKR